MSTGLVQLNDLLQKAKTQIARALPKHLTAERMIRMAMTLYGKNEQLRKCDPISIIACVVQSSELGLELTGPLGHAWMVPYGNQATFQIGYKGFFELAYRSGRVSAFPMRTVYANDVFKVMYGTDQKIIHQPAMKDRGDVIGYYACIYLKDGGRDFEFMSVEDIAEHRRKYVKNNGKSSPWNTAEGPMSLKTCVRMLAKRVPVSTELQVAATVDEYQEAGSPLEVNLGKLDSQEVPVKGESLKKQPDEPATDEHGEVTDPPAEPVNPGKPQVAAEHQLDEIELLCTQKGLATRTAISKCGILSPLGKVKAVGDLTESEAVAVIKHLGTLPDARAPGEDG